MPANAISAEATYKAVPYFTITFNANGEVITDTSITFNGDVELFAIWADNPVEVVLVAAIVVIVLMVAKRKNKE